jgi:hypothetical protein
MIITTKIAIKRTSPMYFHDPLSFSQFVDGGVRIVAAKGRTFSGLPSRLGKLLDREELWKRETIKGRQLLFLVGKGVWLFEVKRIMGNRVRRTVLAGSQWQHDICTLPLRCSSLMSLSVG